MHAQAAKYTPAQREAMAAAYECPGVTARDVVELAAAGELTHPNGARLDAFIATESTVRSEKRRAHLRRERDAELASVSDLPPRDAVERLRLRLVEGISTELDRVEAEQAQGHFVSGENFRQICRAVRELACIPGPDERRPPAPGAKRDGVRQGGETRGGLAGKILAASDQSMPPDGDAS